jgi:hypothetical protein
MKPYYPQADELIEKIFDAAQMARLANEIGVVAIFDQIKFPDSPLKLRDNDPALLNSLYSKAFRFRALSEVNRKFGLDDLLNRATSLLEILKKEYHLE